MNSKIEEFEKKYWHGMEKHDYQIVKNLTHFPCIVAGKKGVKSLDEPTFKALFESGKDREFKIKSFSQIETQIIGENTAVIGYQLEIEYVMQGKKTTMTCVCTSTWTKDKNGWSCIMHTESDLEK